MTSELVVFVLMVVGAVAAAWWRIEAAIKQARDEAKITAQAAGAKADIALTHVADLRTHVAETYVSKQGLRETMDPLMAMLREVKGSVEHLNERIDRVIDSRSQSGPNTGR